MLFCRNISICRDLRTFFWKSLDKKNALQHDRNIDNNDVSVLLSIFVKGHKKKDYVA